MQQSNLQFVQLNSYSNGATGSIGTIDSQVVCYTVLDDEDFFVYGIQQTAAGTTLVQLGVESRNNLVSFETTSIPCGDTIKASKTVIVISCYAQNKIIILGRPNLDIKY